ncbi:MAG: NAD(P)-binding protein [Firmicutes bacterium]|nr:NAD(P)-binding protein [Bacillota bacterium]
MKYQYEMKIEIEKEKEIEELDKLLLTKLKIQRNELLSWKMTKKSLDARKKPNLYFSFQFELELKDKIAQILLKKGTLKPIIEKQKEVINSKGLKLEYRPVIIGSGPSGLLCAYKLASKGLKPIIIERGESVEVRVDAVNKFIKTGEFNENTNIAFGEGGAGTFSDGKLTTRSKSPLVKDVLEILIAGGADKDISYINNPHLGTDGIRNIVMKLRNKIIDKGGTYIFNKAFSSLDYDKENSKLKGIYLDDKTYIKTNTLILAIGHSAKDTIKYLYTAGIPLEAKPFSVGFRIEHEASLINKNQYGRDDIITQKLLGNSEYHLTYKGDRGVYSFCMCPGGVVVPSNSHNGEIVTNGMSYKNRAGKLSNAAIVATVGPDDFEQGALGGIAYQEKIEQKAYKYASENYLAVGQNAKDFINKVKSPEIKVDFKPSYIPGIIMGDFWEVLPENICEELRAGLIDFDRKIPGFIEKGFITGPETRTSSPVRILRDENAMILGYNGVYAIGEGAGYAGGIVSSGIDGLKMAYGILKEYDGVNN